MAPVQLGPYLIGEPLGQGGMGTVYTATHQQTGDVVAIKVLSRLGATEPNLRQRFFQEIERSLPCSVDRSIDRSMSTDHDHVSGGVQLSNSREHL